MDKISSRFGAAWFFSLALAWSSTSLAQEDADGPEVWGPLWEPAWESGWFTQASPFTLDVALGRRTYAERVTGVSDLTVPSGAVPSSAAVSSDQAEFYALARVSLPWETFLPEPPVAATLVVSQPSSEHRLANAEIGSGTVIPSEAQAEEPSFGPQGVSWAKQTAAKPGSSPSAAPATPQKVEHSAQDARSALLFLVRTTVEKVKIAPGSRAARIRLDSLIHRSRMSGFVPEVRLRGVYGFDQTTSLEDAAGLYPGESTTRGGHDSLLEARLTFRLDRLILGDSESTLERQRTQLEEDQGKRIAQALSHLLEWKTAAARAADSRLLPEEQAEAAIDEETALAHLYLLTGGWFRGRNTVKGLGLEEALFPGPVSVPLTPAVSKVPGAEDMLSDEDELELED
jgi:hypothetical protein